MDINRLRQGYLQADDWRRLTEAASYIASLPIWIDDNSAPSIHELRDKVQRAQAMYNQDATDTSAARKLGLVVIDCLQLMKGREGAPSREQEIREISGELKRLAKELAISVIALYRLKPAETRTTKGTRPQLSDLRESGVTEDADTIIFIHRDEYYNPELTDLRGIAELIIAKQRNGPTGKVLTRFTASCTRFDNLLAADGYESMITE